MAAKWKDPPGLQPDGPSASRSLGGNRTEDILEPVRDQAKRTIVDGISRGLLDVEPEDRVDLLKWVVGRGLLGLACERGFVDAAATAYEFADRLAGVGA